MPNTKIVNITNYVIELYKSIDKRYIVFLVFVFISAFLWLLNALSERYTTIISHPVIYKNMPDDKILVNKLPAELDLRVTAHGFDLVQELISRGANPISINVKKYIHSGTVDRYGGHKFYILTKQGSYDIISQMSKDILIENIEPDSILFTFSGIIDKKVPVKPLLNLSYERQYQAKGPLTVAPDSVVLSGPAVMLDSIAYVTTEPLEIEDLCVTTKRSLAVKSIENVSVSPKRVTVDVPVEQFTEGEVEVPVKAVNVPFGVEVQLLPDMLDVRYVCGMSVFNEVQTDQFLLTIDVSELLEELPDKAEAQLSSFPASMNYVRVENPMVEYYILSNEKK